MPCSLADRDERTGIVIRPGERELLPTSKAGCFHREGRSWMGSSRRFPPGHFTSESGQRHHLSVVPRPPLPRRKSEEPTTRVRDVCPLTSAAVRDCSTSSTR